MFNFYCNKKKKYKSTLYEFYTDVLTYQIGTNLRDDNTFSHTLVGMKNRINPIKEDLAIFNKITYAFTL